MMEVERGIVSMFSIEIENISEVVKALNEVKKAGKQELFLIQEITRIIKDEVDKRY